MVMINDDFRKQELQELRRLQRDEAHQKLELQHQGQMLVDQQTKKFQQEQAVWVFTWFSNRHFEM